MLDKIKKELKREEALLVECVENRFYLTGFKSSAGYLLITNMDAILFVDFRYYESAKNKVKNYNVVLMEKPIEQLYHSLKKNNIKNLYIEPSKTSLSKYNLYVKSFESINISNNNKFENKIEELRSIKNNNEIKLITQAQKITDETFSYILNNIKIGRSEKEIALDMEYHIRKLGSEGVSFDFIVVSGKNSSLPHGKPSEKTINYGDLITMDFGAVIDGYRSDMTRTVAVGDISEEQQKVYNTVLMSQKKAFDVIKPGIICKTVDKVARDYIYSSGYEGCFGHGLGHSVGIDIHENPCFNTRCETILKEGMVLTVEPGIYIENKFGVRIEDMIWVTKNKFLNLTKSDKNLVIL